MKLGANAFLPCQIPFSVIVGLHKVRDKTRQADRCSKINSSYLSKIEFLGKEEHHDQGQNMKSLPQRLNTRRAIDPRSLYQLYF